MRIPEMFRNSPPHQVKAEEHADGWTQTICINENYDNLVEVGHGEQVNVLEKFMFLLEKLKIIQAFDFYSAKSKVSGTSVKAARLPVKQKE
jgi:hypothetical protein